jgi:hypothetical protein
MDFSKLKIIHEFTFISANRLRITELEKTMGEGRWLYQIRS